MESSQLAAARLASIAAQSQNRLAANPGINQNVAVAPALAPNLAAVLPPNIPPSHPLYQQAQAQYAATMANLPPVVLDRIIGQTTDGHQEEIGREEVEETYSEEIFAHYQHQEVLPGCLPHPGDVVEAGSLAVSAEM